MIILPYPSVFLTSESGYTSQRNTLQGINISPQNGILKMIFLFPRWDMLIPWRVLVQISKFLVSMESYHLGNPGSQCVTLTMWRERRYLWTQVPGGLQYLLMGTKSCSESQVVFRFFAKSPWRYGPVQPGP